MVDHAIKCGPGTPIACRILANASGPLASLVKQCSMKPKPTIKSRGTSGQRSIMKPRNKSDDIYNAYCRQLLGKGSKPSKPSHHKASSGPNNHFAIGLV